MTPATWRLNANGFDNVRNRLTRWVNNARFIVSSCAIQKKTTIRLYHIAVFPGEQMDKTARKNRLNVMFFDVAGKFRLRSLTFFTLYRRNNIVAAMSAVIENRAGVIFSDVARRSP